MDTFQKYLKNISRANNLDISKNDAQGGQWIFHHGMLFQSPDAWWHNRAGSRPEKRNTLHEGVDILFYKNNKNEMKQLNHTTLVPAANSGTVINICHDFIYQSIIILDTLSAQNKFDLIFVYSHIIPISDLTSGSRVNQGEIIATIAKTDKKKTDLPPHLHLSAMEIPKGMPVENLNWKFFTDKESEINLVNPVLI